MAALLTTQDYIDTLAPDVSWRVILKFIWIITMRISAPILILFTNFGGFLPYKQWRCLDSDNNNNTQCKLRVERNGISRDSFCGVEREGRLLEGVDMEWQLDGRKTYAIDWDLLCEREYLGTFISSSFFIGALVTLLFTSFLFDKYGRLRIVKICQVLSIILSLLMAFPPNIWYLIMVRCLFGGVFFVHNTGHHILTVELTPKSLKGMTMGLAMSTWTIGQFLLALLAYLFKDWKLIIFTGTFFMCTNLYPVFFLLPESPLYLLSNRGDKNASKEALAKLARFFGSKHNFETITLTENVEEDVKESSIREAIGDFKTYPILFKHVAILTFVWLKCGWVYYGFTFSWGQLGRDLYISYVLNGCGEFIAGITLFVYFERLPRRSLAYFDFLAAITLLIAITPDTIGFSAISLSQLASLVGAVASALVFAAQFLWTQELSPTIHRGKILCLCTSSGRMGALLGPQASLLFAWNKAATLIIFAAVALISGLLTLLLPETRGDTMPSQPSELFSRSGQVKAMKEQKLKARNETEFEKPHGRPVNSVV